MKIALTVEKQFRKKPKRQKRYDLPLSLLEKLTLEDISPIWASRLKKEIYQPLCHQHGCNGALNYVRLLSVL